VKLSEKIIELRKQNGMTQEELAAVCNVTRQSISKWEADIALPETEKLLILGNLFHVSMDVLLKDEQTVNAIQPTHHCGNNAVKEKEAEIFEGILIKESINDENVIDFLNINKIELWNTGGIPKYWTVLFFTGSRKDLPELFSKVMRSGDGDGNKWFVDFKGGNKKYIVFKDKVLKYRIGNRAEKELVCSECRKMGILDEQMNWSE